MFTKKHIIQLFKEQWPNVDQRNIKLIVNNTGGISAFECVLLHLHILSTRPRHVIEFSPNHGYSTFAIASAQKAMRNRCAFATFEINAAYAASTTTLLDVRGLLDYCQVTQGNAIVEVPKYIDQKGASVDLCFIDSDHRAPFAKKYIEKLFPKFKEGCLIAIHDIAGTKRSANGKSGFKSSLLGGMHKGGEESPIRDLLKKDKIDHVVLHSVTGGKHEGANLPVNDALYEEVLKISGIDFRKVKSECCPKTLFFNI